MFVGCLRDLSPNGLSDQFQGLGEALSEDVPAPITFVMIHEDGETETKRVMPRPAPATDRETEAFNAKVEAERALYAKQQAEAEAAGWRETTLAEILAAGPCETEPHDKP